MGKRSEKGISTVAATVLFVILIFILQTFLFLAVYRYNSLVQDAIKTETERVQERIVLSSLLTTNSSGIECVYALLVNNTGAITVHIRAIYVDNEFKGDPSDPGINPGDTYVNAKETSWILTPLDIHYSKDSTITIATERGTKSTDYQGKLKQAGGGIPPSKFEKFYLGPLMLDFTKFYFARVDSRTGDVILPWMYGWEIFAGTGPVAWNITVKNIDNRDITLNQFSVFTLWANDQPSNRLPWYIEPPENRLSQHIKSNETVQIIYKWATPKTNSTKLPNTQSVYNTEARCRNFLTFFGIFHETDGSTKPYGQTIPFEAVLVDKVQIQVTASPNVIIANSSMYSTITATVTKNRNPAIGAQITFTTTAGTLSSSSVVTDSTGTATVYLYPTVSPATATVTATWITISGSATVQFAVPTLQTTASPLQLVIKSNMNSTISSVVRLAGSPVIGVNVTFTTTAGNLSSSWAITDATGRATVSLTARYWITTASASVTSKWLYVTSPPVTVTFTVESIQVAASPTAIAANSTMKSTITATLKAGTSPIVGANVTFTTNTSSLSSSWAITNTNGVATVYLNAGQYPATANVTAKWINTLGSTIVVFETATVQVSASPTLIPTNSTSKATITALVMLGASPYAGANVTFATDGGSLSSSWAITDANGMAHVYLFSSMFPENVTVTANWMNASSLVSVRFTNLFVATDRLNYSQNETVRISGLLRDQNGAPVEGVSVSLVITASNGTIVWSVNSTLTDSNGAFTYDLQLINAVPDTYTIIATYQTFEERHLQFTVTG